MTLPFNGLRVIDLTTVIAGPYCAYHLALTGAEVIKVESPDGGDLARRLGADPALNALDMGASYLALAAGKRSLALNLKPEPGKDVLRRLAAGADVVLENFRPGVMTRLGVDWENLRERNPRLIYCAISGFGQEGSYRANPAYDQIVQGLSGAMSATGTEESGPLRAGYPISDTVAGLNAAYAIAAALVQRERSGEGQFIDVSMLDSTLSIMGWVTSNHLIAGQPPVRVGNDNFTASPSGSFRVRDGLINVAANKQAQFEALCREIGREDLLADARFGDPEARLVHRDALKAELERTFAEDDGPSWVKRLNSAGIPAGPVLGMDEALALPPIAERDSVQSIDNVPGVKRPVQVFTSGYRLSGGAPKVGNPPPRLGQDSRAILAELGYDETEIDTLARDGVIGEHQSAE